mmetsp:Transcript_29780/g.94927  ORF Transcript_29780/g.94927 Transcript_29780/m.94927 type:complete len:255 (+) Transcript_29780:101-865(+)
MPKCAFRERLRHLPRQLFHCALVDGQKRTQQLAAHALEDAPTCLDVRDNLHDVRECRSKRQSARRGALHDQGSRDIVEDSSKGWHAHLAEHLYLELEELRGVQWRSLLHQAQDILLKLQKRIGCLELRCQLIHELKIALLVEFGLIHQDRAEILQKVRHYGGFTYLLGACNQELQNLGWLWQLALCRQLPQIADERCCRFWHLQLLAELGPEGVKTGDHGCIWLVRLENVCEVVQELRHGRRHAQLSRGQRQSM